MNTRTVHATLFAALIAASAATALAQKVNTDSDPAAPFGGYKRSGNGREGGVFGFESYLELKALLGSGSTA